MVTTASLPVVGPCSPLLSRPGLKLPAFASIPEFYDTLGDEVNDFARSECGFPPDPQQELAIDILFARDKRGRSAAFSTTLIACRQQLKTGVWKIATLAWLYLFGEPLVTWSAHRAETSFAAQRDLERIIEASDMLSRATNRFVHGNGSEAIETVGREMVQFRTRTKTGGKGLSANKVILDEAFALQPLHMGSLLPTMTAMPDPQVMYGSSACMEDSDILHQKVKDGRPGTERDWVTDQPLIRTVPGPMAAAYLEWCAPLPEIACDAGAHCTHAKTAVGCGCDKPEMIRLANPSIGPLELVGTPGGPRTSLEFMVAERGELPPAEYAREHMGWHERPRAGASPMSMTMWYSACADKESRVAEGSPVAVGIGLARDRSLAAVGLAGWRADGLPHGELIEYLPGTGWVLDFVLGVAARNNPCATVLDPSGPAGAFEKPLRLNKFITCSKNSPDPPRLVEGQRLLMTASTQEVAQACGMITDRVNEGQFRHPDQVPLNRAADGARGRPVGQAWAWDENTDPAMVAVTLALLGLATYGAKRAPTPFFLT